MSRRPSPTGNSDVIYSVGRVNLQENIPLAPLTTLQVGGPARYFVEASNVDEVREAVEFSRTKDFPVFVLGGGSNLVVSDAGWPGLVLKIGIQRDQSPPWQPRRIRGGSR